MPQVLIYTASLCPYCTMAKRLLDRKGVIYQEINVDASAARDALVAKSKRRTVPQIYIGDYHVGGYDDLAALERRQELEPLLMA